MKKKLALVITLVCTFCLSAALLAGCSSSSEKEKFILGFDNTFKPFGYMDENNEPTGFDIDLATEACERLGWELQLEPIAWDSKDSLIDSGQITVVWNGFTITPEREEVYTFTNPYFKNSQVIVVKEGSDIKTSADLAGKTVCTQANSSAYGLLTEGGAKEDLGKTCTITTQPEYNTAFMDLESGAVDAIVMDLPVANANVADRTGFVVLDEVLYEETYGIGFKKGETEKAAALEKVLKEMYADGTVEEIAKKYSDEYSDVISMDNWLLK